MKRIIGLFLLMLLNVLLYAQNNRYKVVTKTWYIKDNKEYKLEKDEIIESDMSTFYVTYDYYNDERELFNLYLKANYKNEEIYMYAYSSELELIDSIKLFNQEFNCFIPVYYLDVLKTKNRNLVFSSQSDWKYFKDNYLTMEGESFYDAFYPEEIVLSNLFTYFTHNNYFIMKKITYEDGYYKLNLYTPKTDAMGYEREFFYQQPYPETYMNHKDENEITLYLKFDGDYVDVWINSLKEYMGKYFAAPKESTQHEINQLVSTGKCDFDNVYWPRHADGSSDFDRKKIQPMVKLASTEITIAPNVPVNLEQKLVSNVARDKIMVTTRKLEFRVAERLDSSIMTVLKKNTKVKVVELGKEDTIDGVFSNWVCVEIQDSVKSADGRKMPKGLRGWVFGGYLKQEMKQ